MTRKVREQTAYQSGAYLLGVRFVLNERSYMYAVIKTGGKQYRVAAGEKIKVEQIAADVGQEITIDQVLAVGVGADLRGEDTTTSGIEATDAAVGDETNLAGVSSDFCGAADPFCDDCPAAFCLASAISSLVSAT